MVAKRKPGQDPLVLHSYWLARRPDEPHIGYGSRKNSSAQGLTGLALSGGIFGLFVSAEFLVPVISVLLTWWTFSPLLHDSSAGWYEVDTNGTAVAYLGRTPPAAVRGRMGLRLPTFVKHAQLMRRASA